MGVVDVLIATALEMERDAVRSAAAWRDESQSGVRHWDEKDTDKYPDYLLGEYMLAGGGSMTVALARPTRMGGIFMSDIVSTLMERLHPRCLAMCGVCAGNPSDLALGDVAIANTVFQYDDGKRTSGGFHGDLFPTPMDVRWVQHANGLRPEGLPSHGDPSRSDASLWLLESLCAGADPKKHPAFPRYFPAGTWTEQIKQMEEQSLLRRDGRKFVITDHGKEFLDSSLAYEVDAPSKLPFAIKVGPMASGNAVVKDGVTWDMLKTTLGQRSAIALEMEAASIGVAGYTRSLSQWIVVKGVMDHADPEKNDRYKPFAARASAEVLLRFLEQVAARDKNGPSHKTTVAIEPPLPPPVALPQKAQTNIGVKETGSFSDPPPRMPALGPHEGAVADAARTEPSIPQPIVVVLTALTVEAKAVVTRLTDRQREAVKGTWLEWGQFGSWNVVVAEIGAGNPTSASVATRLLDHYSPAIAALVGIAGGVKDVAVGDVVVATKVYGYESGKETQDGFLPRPSVQNTSHEPQTQARLLGRTDDWHEKLTQAIWSGRKPAVFVAPIAAGEAVVAATEGRIATLLGTSYSDTVAVAMEDRGFLEAAHVHHGGKTIVVRGISDLLSGKAQAEAENSQPRAADAAAAFFFAMLDLKPGPVATDRLRERGGETSEIQRGPKPNSMEPAATPAPLSTDSAASGSTSPSSTTNGEEDQRRQREEWKKEREKELEEELVTQLKSATSLMAMLERKAPPGSGISEAPNLAEEARARRIFRCLMKTAPFTDALKWLSDAYNAVPRKDRGAGSALAEIARSLIPWLYIAGCPGQFSQLEGVNLGRVVGLPIGLHCFAEIVSAGLELRAAEFVGGEKPKPRGCMSLSDPPLSGPKAAIEEHLRSELFSKLDVLAEFKNADPGKKDKRINARLVDLQEAERKRYYFTFFVTDYGDMSLLERIAIRYPALAIIQLDSRWTETQDSWWVKISRLLGYES